MKPTPPSSDDFRRKCLKCFQYLVTEHGFALQPQETGKDADKFSVSYTKADLVIIIVGRHFGYGADLILRRSEQCEVPVPQNPTMSELADLILRKSERCEVWLGHLLNLRDREGSNKPWAIEGQLNQVAAWADALRTHAADFLAGDLATFEEAREEQQRVYRANWDRKKEESRSLP